jgi:putative Mg2+ transporter-C (MgtC) family protein
MTGTGADLVAALRADLLLQLVLATALGGVIGLERELKGKPAGLRTNILICIGAATFTHLSLQVSQGHGDPGRIAAQVLTGVGFIGAGTILHTRGSVTGLTSAATIWVVSAIGMALGMGLYYEAIGTTTLVMAVLLGLSRVEVALGRYSTTSRFTIHARPEPSPVEDLRILVERSGLDVVRCDVRLENVDLVIEMEVRGARRLHEQALNAIVHHPAVRSVSTGE